MRSPKEIAEAVENAVHKVNTFYSKTQSPNGTYGVIARSQGKGLSFRERYYEGEPLKGEYVANLISKAANEFDVPVDHIIKVGGWVY